MLQLANISSAYLHIFSLVWTTGGMPANKDDNNLAPLLYAWSKTMCVFVCSLFNVQRSICSVDYQLEEHNAQNLLMSCEVQGACTVCKAALVFQWSFLSFLVCAYHNLANEKRDRIEPSWNLTDSVPQYVSRYPPQSPTCFYSCLISSSSVSSTAWYLYSFERMKERAHNRN